MTLPSTTRFTKDHEWASPQGQTVRIGITQYAADELGDIVFVELPQPGDQIEKGEPFGSIESVKAVSDLVAPISGTVLRVNAKLSDAPETVNEAPEEEGWMIEIEPDDAGEVDDLMDIDGYEAYLDQIA